MSVPSSLLPLQVLAAHGAELEPRAADQFRRGLSVVVKRVEDSLRKEHPYLHLEPQCVTAEQVGALSAADVRRAAAVLDVTSCDACLALVVGRLDGAGVPCITVCHEDCAGEALRLGLSNPGLLTYGSLDELFQADSMLQQELQRAVHQARIQDELIYQFWFPRETSALWVICPQIYDAGEFADRSSPDYTYLDNLGDTDALLEVMVFLSQYYPSATIEPFSAGDLPEGHTSGNLVVIGGPGSKEEISNEICREMMREIGSSVSYSADCEEMIVTRDDGNTARLRAEYLSDEHQEPGGMRRDQGYFARFANPLNENATVVLINGIHTTGVLGAARAFSERREALRNFNAVLTSAAGPASFECHFDVRVLNGEVKVPAVDPQNTLPLGRTPDVATGMTTSGRGLAPATAESVRVLFIAGDRGGSQVSQVQIPKEYHTIQSALRSCKHREVIALANPILGATHARLAAAYRERPAIVHFAGHGNDRSLSIIEDHGLLANETPLEAKQLAELLQTMENRVRLCVLNACQSEELARQVVKVGAVDCAVGWPGRVSDSAAIAFSEALYGALGDARSLRDAVSVGSQACGPQYEPVLVASTELARQALVLGNGD